jgi:protein-S-isoprenylcysteine O-methyltransferase Ste14
MRYWIALVMVCVMPPFVPAWIALQIWTPFWRRLGPARTYAIFVPALVAMAGLLASLRGPIMAVSFGVQPGLLVLAALLWVWACVLAVARWRQLGSATVVGLTELRATPTDPGKLITEGIYTHIRHPRYVELGLAMLAIACFCNYLAMWVEAVGFWPSIYVVVLLEERELRQRFGESYVDYCRRVPRFIPRLWQAKEHPS